MYYAKNSKKNYLIGDSLTFSLNISGIGAPWRPSTLRYVRQAALFIPEISGTVFGAGYQCSTGIIKEYANATIDGRTITDGIWNKVSACLGSRTLNKPSRRPLI